MTRFITYCILLFTLGWILGTMLLVGCFPLGFLVYACIDWTGHRIGWLLTSALWGGIVTGPYLLWKIVREALGDAPTIQVSVASRSRSNAGPSSAPRCRIVAAYMSAAMGCTSASCIVLMLVLWPYSKGFLDVVLLLLKGLDQSLGLFLGAFATSAVAIIAGNCARGHVLGKAGSIGGAIVCLGLLIFVLVAW